MQEHKMLLIENSAELEVNEHNLPLLADLLLKWGYNPLDKVIEVTNLSDISSELSAWGIPWKRTKWDY